MLPYDLVHLTNFLSYLSAFPDIYFALLPFVYICTCVFGLFTFKSRISVCVCIEIT